MLKQRYPNLTTHQIKQAVGKQWSLLSSDQKAPFEDMSRSDKNFCNNEYEQPKKSTLKRSFSAISI